MDVYPVIDFNLPNRSNTHESRAAQGGGGGLRSAVGIDECIPGDSVLFTYDQGNIHESRLAVGVSSGWRMGGRMPSGGGPGSGVSVGA